MMSKRRKFGLNIGAFVLALVAGYLALTEDAFLFFAVVSISILAALFHSSQEVKAAAASSLLGFGAGLLVLFIAIINSDFD